jgi:hypothetical protein
MNVSVRGDIPPQLYPRACICLMMYFKNNWNAGPFFLLHGFLEEKKTYLYIYIYIYYINFQTCYRMDMGYLCFLTRRV